MQENSPRLWRRHLPRRTAETSKYDFGHALIFGADKMTGATRLAAEACARIGAGLTTVVAPAKAAAIYPASLPPHIIVEDLSRNTDLHFKDRRRNACLIGPGAGRGFPALRSLIAKSIKAGKKLVIDADGLNAIAPHTSFQEFLSPQVAGGLGREVVVLTPHEGEFARLFPDIKGSKASRAQKAAKRTRAIIVLKGSDTLIASPRGLAMVNKDATPWLATAGTGDVLAGMITGLLAQGMEPFDASCAAVWIHAQAARQHGPGLVAGDLPSLIRLIVPKA